MDLDSTPRLLPARLHPGDTVAVVSPSWGGPFAFPAIYEAGLETLRRLGLEIIEMPTARREPEAHAADPAGRAADLNAAFANPEISAIFASIGGDDSARILPHLDSDAIQSNPKILMGYSDTTVQLMFAHQLGLVTFNGPSVMSGFAQARHFPEFEAHIRSILFEPTPTYDCHPYPRWVDTGVEWATIQDPTTIGEQLPHDGWHWLNGDTATVERLAGGCVEVLEFLKGSHYWPDESWWAGRILFLESSEEVPIVTNMDFGHTDPQWILPLGVLAELDPVARTFRLIEPAVA